LTVLSGPEDEEHSDTCAEALTKYQCSEESNAGDSGHGVSFL
jgi:hypothetical protein